MARTAVTVQHLTPEQLAERLQVDEATLFHWRRDGKGPAYIRGESKGTKATVRYPLAEIEAWEQRRLVTPAAST